MAAPRPLPDTGLPVEDAVPALREALAGGRPVVLTAEPGAGKTTVVPLRLLGEPWLEDRRIVVLEPRRVAARAAARRMAQLLGEDVGMTVGFRTRDERRVGPATRIEVVTDGVLTRRLQADPGLAGVGLVVFDEFHERSLQADLGLALTLDVRDALRPDLRLLVMSATLDVRRVADHLDALVVTSEGRQHPVEVRWSPRGKQERLEPAVVEAVRRALREERGDVLVFLPGAGEIRRVEQALRAAGADDVADVRPLFGALPAAEQDEALAPGTRRKVVLSTDIAETSLTVEGVRVVVDGGLARVPRYDAGTGLTRLVTLAASKASADQRAGRAGRIEPGVAYRLWSKIEHAARRPHLEPEITQVDVAGLVLELAAWGVTDPDALPLLDRPPRRSVEEARALLRALGALDEEGRITGAGRQMVALPLHPRLARMVTSAAGEGDGWTACLLAAAVEERDVLRGPPDQLPADVDLRLRLLDDPTLRHPLLDGRARSAVRSTAEDVARRVGVQPGDVAFDRAGSILALAYPDRVAQNRGGSTAGRFRLRTGSGAWVPPTDLLATQPFVVAADLDGRRQDARIRLGAHLDADDVVQRFGTEVVERVSVVWDRERDDLVERAERTLGSLRLGVVERRPAPGAATERVLRERLRAHPELLSWSDGARRLQARLAFLHRHRAPDGWPDVGDRAIAATLDLTAVSSRAEVAAIDLTRVLRALVPPQLHDALDRLAPPDVRLASGRHVPVDYGTEPPSIAVRVQHAFGTTATPTVLEGQVPLVVHLLSPADRAVQVTSDLAGFWSGSWHDVRKEMSGRYPKHAWPADPSAGG